MDKSKFGNYVKEKRTERGLTQKELAEALCIDVSAVSKWERGVGYPDITLIPDICRVLAVSEHELIESGNDTEARAVKSEARKYRRLKNGVFYGLCIAYGTAVLTCFIVNLAVGHTLSWFFPVLAGCLCGFAFAPTCTRFFPRYRLPVFIGSTFLSLFLLYLCVSVYTGTYWVWMATAGTALGWFLTFFPILFFRQDRYLSDKTWQKVKRWFTLSYTVGAMALTVLLLATVAAYTEMAFIRALEIAAYSYVLPVVWGLIALLPGGKLCRVGIDCLLFGGWAYGCNGVLNALLDADGAACYRVDFGNFAECSDGNVALIVLCTSAFAGILLLVSALFKKRRR